MPAIRSDSRPVFAAVAFARPLQLPGGGVADVQVVHEGGCILRRGNPVPHTGAGSRTADACANRTVGQLLE